MSSPQYVDDTIYGPITQEQRKAFYDFKESRKADIPIKVSVGPSGGPYKIEVLDLSQAPGKYIRPFKCPFPGCTFQTARRRTVGIHFCELHKVEVPQGMSWDDHPSVRWYTRQSSAKQLPEDATTPQAEASRTSSNSGVLGSITAGAQVDLSKAVDGNSIATPETRREHLGDFVVKLESSITSEPNSKAAKSAVEPASNLQLTGAITPSKRKRPRQSKNKKGSKVLENRCQVKDESQDNTTFIEVGTNKTDEICATAILPIAAASPSQEPCHISKIPSPVSNTSSHTIQGDEYARRPVLDENHVDTPKTPVHTSPLPVNPTVAPATPTPETRNDQVQEDPTAYSDDGQEHDPFADPFDGQYEALLEQQFGDSIPWREPFTRAKAGGPDANDAITELTRVVDEAQSQREQLDNDDLDNIFSALLGTQSQHDVLMALPSGSGLHASAANAELGGGLAACMSFIDQMNVVVQAEPGTSKQLIDLLHTPGPEAHAEFHRILADARNTDTTTHTISLDAAPPDVSSEQLGQDSLVADNNSQPENGGGDEMDID